MKIALKNEIFVIGSLPIGTNGILGNRREFMRMYQRPPEELRLGIRASKRLNQLANPMNDRPPYDFIMGMRVVVDPSLDKDEWRIGYGEEIIYERENNGKNL